MTGVETLSPVVSAVAAVLVLLGAGFALIGSFGLLRLPTFYERVHPPTMGTTLGIALVIGASMLVFSALESRPVLHELVIAVFAIVTTPVTYVLLLRAAIRREKAERPEHGASAR
ncbi:MAG TPA: monovalent cation/H(+) antiporter subunit G [Casimicrobiaceae bacterium]|nr:monovalent cation/H(+) antiporter subunit G [Casimicrobiaceae bacterium]